MGKLTAILAADVVGFSGLAGADEDRTLARLRALRSDLIDPTIAVHKGRVVKRTGPRKRHDEPGYVDPMGGGLSQRIERHGSSSAEEGPITEVTRHKGGPR